MRRKISALTLGSLVLAGGCKDSLPSTDGINVSEARLKALAKEQCKWYQKCYSESFAEYYDSVDDCVKGYQSYFADLLDADYFSDSQDAVKCVDALLDLYTCMFNHVDSCVEYEQDFFTPGVIDACGKLYDAYDEACEALYEDAYYSYAPDISQPVFKRRIRSLREGALRLGAP